MLNALGWISYLLRGGKKRGQQITKRKDRKREKIDKRRYDSVTRAYKRRVSTRTRPAHSFIPDYPWRSALLSTTSQGSRARNRSWPCENRRFTQRASGEAQGWVALSSWAYNRHTNTSYGSNVYGSSGKRDGGIQCVVFILFSLTMDWKYRGSFKPQRFEIPRRYGNVDTLEERKRILLQRITHFFEYEIYKIRILNRNEFALHSKFTNLPWN